MRRLSALVLVLVLAASAAAQEPEHDVVHPTEAQLLGMTQQEYDDADAPPTWQEAEDNPQLASQYPGWKPDAETELGPDDFEACDGDDDCNRALLQRAINELIHQRAEIAQLRRELAEIHAQQQADRDAMKGVFRCDKPDCIRLQFTFTDPSTYLVWKPLLIQGETNNHERGGVVIGKGKP